MNNAMKKTLPAAILLAVIFGATMILFSELQPFILFDADDWTTINFQRNMMPLPGQWNPTRVFPEVFGPLCANVAAYVIMPFTGDYVESLKMECALVCSVFIVVYVGLMYAVLRRRFAASVGTAVLLSALFFLLHFIVVHGSTHLFQASNYTLTNLFYYALSALLCCSIVLFLMLEDVLDGFFSKHNSVKKGVFLVFLYLGLNSNLFASIIVAAYVGIDLLVGLIAALRKKNSVGAFAQRSVAKLLVVLAWFAVQFIEMTGGRAKGMQGDASLLESAGNALIGFFKVNYDAIFVAIACAIIVSFIVMVLRHKAQMMPSPQMRMICVMALAGILTLLYLALLCGRVGPAYLVRPDVLISVFFFVLAAIICCLSMLASCYPRVNILVPFVVVFVMFHVHLAVDSTVAGISSDNRKAITDEVIGQVLAGAESGKETVEVHVPVFSTSDNWPIATYGAYHVSRSLWLHGMTDGFVSVELVPDPAVNEMFGIPVPETESGS